MRASADPCKAQRSSARCERRQAFGAADDAAGAPGVAAVGALPELALRRGPAKSRPSRGDERVRHRGQRLGQAAGERMPGSRPAAGRCAPAGRGGRARRTARCSPRRTSTPDRPDRRRPTTCSGGRGPRPPAARSRPRRRSTLRRRRPPRTRDPRRAGAMRASARRAARPGRWSCHVSPPSVERISPPSSIPTRSSVGVVRAGRDPAHVRRPRPRREAPRRPRRELEQRVELAASVSPRSSLRNSAARLGARVHRAVGRADGEREDAGLRQPAVDPGPAAVGRPPHAALAQPGVDGVGIGRDRPRGTARRSRERQLDRPLPSVSSSRAIPSPVAAYRRVTTTGYAATGRDGG